MTMTDNTLAGHYEDFKKLYGGVESISYSDRTDADNIFSLLTIVMDDNAKMRKALERISQFTIPKINALSEEAQIASDVLLETLPEREIEY